MAELVGVFAASHGPLIARDWHLLPEALKARLTKGFREVGARLDASRPDILIVIAPDHWINFFLNNLPSVCIGIGAEHDGPPEAFLADFPHKQMAGDPQFGSHLLETALASQFDPAISHRLRLDHGFCIPLMRMELSHLPRLLPIVINDLEPPMPSVARCAAWGHLIARAIATYPEPARIAILASGGLSHSIGEPTMGQIDEAFDRAAIAAFRDGEESHLVESLEAGLRATGNGAHEVRNWVAAHAAAGSRGFELIDYFPAPEVYVGCGFAAWNKG